MAAYIPNRGSTRMRDKGKKLVSFWLEPLDHENLRRVAKLRGASIARLVRNLVVYDCMVALKDLPAKPRKKG